MLVPINYYSTFTVNGAKGTDAYTLFYLYGYGEINKEDYAMKIADLVITSLETITAFTASDGQYLFTLDELQNATIAQSQESTDITGRAGRKLSTMKRNKTFTISASNGMVSTGLLEAQTGGTINSGFHTVNWSEELDISDASAKLTYKAVGTEGKEIKSVYIKNCDGTLGDSLVQVAGDEEDPVEEGKFSYDPATKTLTFDNEIEGDMVYVIYDRSINANQLQVDDSIADVKAELFIDAIAEDKCANQFRVQIHVPKADVSAEFSIDMGDNQAVHSFDAEALAGACCKSGYFWTWTVFGANAEDYENGTDTNPVTPDDPDNP